MWVLVLILSKLNKNIILFNSGGVSTFPPTYISSREALRMKYEKSAYETSPLLLAEVDSFVCGKENILEITVS